MFFDVIESGDLSHLIKSGSGDLPDDAVEVWEGIVDEYTKLSNNTQYAAQLNKQSALLRDINRINTVTAALSVIQYGSIEADKALKHFGITFDTMDELKSIISMYKGESIRLQIRKAEIENVKGGDVDFYEVLAAVEKELGRGIDVDRTSVRHWCAIVNNLKNGRNNKEK